MVILVAREAGQVEHDHEMDQALGQAAECEQLLKLTTVRRLGALAFLVEAFDDLVALAAAVLFARAELRWQPEVLGLLLRADAHGDHRADHDQQIRPICGHGQDAFARHGFYSGIRQPSWYISTTMQAIVSACRRINATS